GDTRLVTHARGPCLRCAHGPRLQRADVAAPPAISRVALSWAVRGANRPPSPGPSAVVGQERASARSSQGSAPMASLDEGETNDDEQGDPLDRILPLGWRGDV